MPLESATYISDLDTSNPVGSTDKVQTLDDHVRLLKSTIKTTFPGVAGAVTPTHTELNYVDGVTSAIQTQIDGKAATSHNHSAADLTSGTVPDARFPATLPAASGVNLTALNGTNIASGTVADARLSSQVCLKDSEITGADGAGVADPGYRGLPTATDETPVLTDAGKLIVATANVTIPANASVAYPIGTVITVVNNTAGTLTVAVTSDTLRWAGTGGTDGTRTIASHQGVATLLKTASTLWVISGNLS